MRKLLALTLLLSPFFCAAQQDSTFTIKGQVGHLNAPAKAYLLYQLGANKVLDSAAITNGNFTISSYVIYPTTAVLLIDRAGVGLNKLGANADNLKLYLEKGDIVVTSADSIAKAEITGSPINADNKKLMAQLNTINAKAKKIVDEAHKAPADKQNTPEFQNAMQAQLKTIQTEQQNVLKTFITGNPNSYLSLLALGSLSGPSANPAELDALYNSLAGSLKLTEAGKTLKSSLDMLKVTAIGALAPDFTQNDIHGIPVKLSSFRGKYVLLDFWASWCGPCRQENPNIIKAFDKYKSKNFTVLGVSLDRPTGKTDWISAIKNDGLAWTQVSDLKGWDNEAAALYFVSSIPQNFLIDPDGRIIAKNLRGDDLEAKLKEIFGKKI